MMLEPLLYTVLYGIYILLLATLVALTIRPLIKGAPFVPTNMERIRKALKMANVKRGEYVYDLGCGDGRLVLEAVKRYDANGVGIEYSPIVYWLACLRRTISGVKTSKARLIYGSYKKHDLRKADVVFCYLMPERLPELKKKLSNELKPGARVVTYVWPIIGWKAEEIADAIPKKNFFRLFLYKMPPGKMADEKITDTR